MAYELSSITEEPLDVLGSLRPKGHIRYRAASNPRILELGKGHSTTSACFKP